MTCCIFCQKGNQDCQWKTGYMIKRKLDDSIYLNSAISRSDSKTRNQNKSAASERKESSEVTEERSTQSRTSTRRRRRAISFQLRPNLGSPRSFPVPEIRSPEGQPPRGCGPRVKTKPCTSVMFVGKCFAAISDCFYGTGEWPPPQQIPAARPIPEVILDTSTMGEYFRATNLDLKTQEDF